MVLINEIGDLDDIKSVLRATVLQAPTWKIRPELRNRTINAAALEKWHWSEISQLITQEKNEIVRDMLVRIQCEEEVHRGMFASLLKPNVSSRERAIGTQMAFIFTATNLAQIEPDKDVKAIFNYVILDHIEHVHVLASQEDELDIDSRLAEEVRALPVGRPLELQFYPTQDLIKEPYEAGADQGTKVNIRLMLAAEAATREQVESLVVDDASELSRHLGSLLGVVENEHQILLQTLLNPAESALERAFLSELTEVTGLNRLLAVEKESGASEAYQFAVDEDEDHLRYLGSMLLEFEGKDPIGESTSITFNAKPRMKQKKYLAELAKHEINLRPSGRSVAEVA